MNTNKAQSGGFSPAAILRDLGTAWRLLWDPRVPAILKFTLPVFAAVYWFFPLDLLPGIVLDDMAVVVIVAKLFVHLASQSTSGDFTTSAAGSDDDNTVSTSWQVVDDN
ncbi:MAG: hypothetical protein KDE47_24490 [Caldilineaceae bacterium]|nr:hypothetical protein [Caldilineaceae bacterium]MCB9148383.1 hypothetical protein [Caldilineaceae bacterium]